MHFEWELVFLGISVSSLLRNKNFYTSLVDSASTFGTQAVLGIIK